MKYFWILIALLALSFAVSAQSDRVKTVETRDSASLVIFDTTGTEYNGVSVQEALEELDFDAGNILYVATTGNDATGVVGYPNKPFIPSYSLSDNTSNIAHWYYPGVYTIGPGQEYPFTFGNQQNPYILYAPNSDLNFINNTNGYLFRPSGSHTNPYFYVLVKKLYLQDLSFIRFFEVNNSGDFFADIKAKYGFIVEFKTKGIPQIYPVYMQTAIFRLVQEAVNNSRKHAGVSKVQIILSESKEQLEILIEDQGSGFDTNRAFINENRFGIAGMQERVDLLEGRMKIQSKPGAGTQILIEIPLKGRN
mgnify:CR=1 FL=1